MALTPEQFNGLLEDYADQYVDAMSEKEARRILYDCVVENGQGMDDEALLSNIENSLSNEAYEKLLEKYNVSLD